MTRLRPNLPYDPEETPISWATRLAGLHTGGELLPFLHDIRIPYGDMQVNRESALERLCELTGEDRDPVFANAIHLLSWRHYALRGNPFTAEFLHGKSTMFCPACLAEDDARGRPAVHRRGRTIWLFRPVRTCPHHNLPLIERRATRWSDVLREMAIIVPETGQALAGLAAHLTPRPPSPLQNYCLARLQGGLGPGWLDGQGIEHASRACEMLGVTLLFGSKPNLKKLTNDDWNAAGHAGFEYASRGEDGIRDALTLIQTRFVQSGSSATSLSGPQMVFGRLYQWLEFSSTKKDPGPIRGLLREHILDTMAIDPDRVLLGEPVKVRRRHSVQSLAAATGTHQKTVRNFLVIAGLIPEDPLKAVIASVDAAEGERLAAQMKTSVAQNQLPRMLNTTRGQVVQLVESGILSPISRPKDKSGGRGAVALEVVQGFLADINRDAKDVPSAPDGMFGIPETAQLSRVTTPVIVRLLLSRALTRVFRLADVPGYGGILLDPAQVRTAARARYPETVVSASRAAERLGMSQTVVRALMADRDGGPFIKPLPMRGSTNIEVRVDVVDDFAKAHVGLIGLSRETGIHHIRLRRRLDAAGIRPIDDPKRLRARIYRRADLVGLSLS